MAAADPLQIRFLVGTAILVCEKGWGLTTAAGTCAPYRRRPRIFCGSRRIALKPGLVEVFIESDVDADSFSASHYKADRVHQAEFQPAVPL